MCVCAPVGQGDRKSQRVGDKAEQTNQTVGCSVKPKAINENLFILKMRNVIDFFTFECFILFDASDPPPIPSQMWSCALTN